MVKNQAGSARDGGCGRGWPRRAPKSLLGARQKDLQMFSRK